MIGGPVAEADVGRVARDPVPAAGLGRGQPGEQVLGVDGSELSRLHRLVRDELHTVDLAAEGGQLAQDSAVAAGRLDDSEPASRTHLARNRATGTGV